MEILNAAAALISLAAVFAFINARYIGLPTTVGIMLISLVLSLLVIIIGKWGFADIIEPARRLLDSVDFHQTLMQGMLSFLLFAGALHVNLNDLAKHKWLILILATLGVLSSTFIVGSLSWLVLEALGLSIPFIYALLFGALISPTDPIAVMGILKKAGVSKSLETKIAGESLFNDGVGVVVFIVLLGIASSGETPSVASIALLFAHEALGGIVFGFVIGLIAFWMLRKLNNYQVEVLISLALVMGGYALASWLHVSGPIAMVVAGLLIGNHGRVLAMSESTRGHLDAFWELLDEILNAVLFVLMGLEVLVLTYQEEYLLAALVIIPLVLLSRFISIGTPIIIMRRFSEFSPQVIEVMTWAGLRGGISIALALSLPLSEQRDLLLAMTYAVVVFSIFVQGLTIGRLVAANHK